MAQSHTAAPLRVLAVASHVTYGYVGNKMVSYILQALGCEPSAINTVQFSNHTAYKSWQGRKTPGGEIRDLYDGLKANLLNNFDLMLSGYTASKEAVEAVGDIAKDLKQRAASHPGSFFWILDPVMGDDGRLYVDPAIPSAYKTLLPQADLILPNCFEAEVLSDVKITDVPSLTQAITKLHDTYKVPHVVVTSVRLDKETKVLNPNTETLAVVGSSRRSDLTPRIFCITVPSLPVFFSGTGDMFAALMLVRLRQYTAASSAAPNQDSTTLSSTSSWQPPDDVPAQDLPLAHATRLTLASMHSILSRTARQRDAELQDLGFGSEDATARKGASPEELKRAHLLRTRASEIRVVQGVEDMLYPDLEPADGTRFEVEQITA